MRLPGRVGLREAHCCSVGQMESLGTVFCLLGEGGREMDFGDLSWRVMGGKNYSFSNDQFSF